MGDSQDFAWALEQIKQGRRVKVSFWQPDKFIFMVNGSNFEVNRAPLNEFYPEGTGISYLPHIDIQTEPNVISVYTPTQQELLLDYWEYAD